MPGQGFANRPHNTQHAAKCSETFSELLTRHHAVAAILLMTLLYSRHQ